MSSWRWPPRVRRNARAMLVSSLVSPTSSSAYQCLVSPNFRFFLKPGVVKRRHQRWFASPTKRRCGGAISNTSPLSRASVSKTDVYNVVELEEEILEYMENSAKPESFPSKKELVDAGRDDLVDAIVKRGGWLLLGWDLEKEEEEEDINEVSEISGSMTTRTMATVESDDILQMIKDAWDDGEGGQREGSEVVSFCPYDDPQSVSSPVSSLEMPTTKHETGIEGMLNRLEKQRNYAFGFGVRVNEDHTFSPSYNNGKVDWQYSTKDKQHESLSGVDGLRNSDDHHEPQMWRSWSIQRAGLRDIDIEDIEIEQSEANNIKRSPTDSSKDHQIIRSVESSANEPAAKNDWNELDFRIEKINHARFIRNRLQQLELEASAVLSSVRSNITDEFVSQKKLYDDLEFWEVQDHEISKAQDKLRSTRAKLAVLEGKMALAVIDARQTMEEKKKKLDNARRALRLVYSTCVVWPNSASSEVFLAGSFDGWATQRKMKKTSTGLFYLWLQLYPGQYEIKFIVDGEWRIDPLRPVVKSSGFENNLLVIL